MLLLVVDTSGKNGSVALVRVPSGRDQTEIIEAVPLAGGTFSAQLVPQIADLLVRNGFGKSDIGAFVAISGPGSFTGLRVGLAAVKALAEVLHKPIVPVSLLEAVACSSSHRGSILAALDAGRGEVYVGEYERSARSKDIPGFDGPRPESDQRGESSLRERFERLLTKEEFIFTAKTQIKGQTKDQTLVTPDPPLAEALRFAGIPCKQIDYPGAAVTASLGWRHLQRGLVVSPDALDANYIRRSDAELYSQPRK